MIKLIKINDRYYSPDSTTGKTFSEMDEIQQGYFLTNSELEQLKREIAEKAYLAGWFSSGEFNPYKRFDEYLNSDEFKQATKKDGE